VRVQVPPPAHNWFRADIEFQFTIQELFKYE
jgi:hypothetical protein